MDLARRASSNATDPDRTRVWNEIAEEVEADREVLRMMLDSFGFGPGTIKSLLAWAGEKAGRFKLNGQLSGPSELGQLFELELMYLGVTGKMSLWMNLAVADYAPLREFDLDELIARAESQRDRLEEQRIALAATVFGGSGTVA